MLKSLSKVVQMEYGLSEKFMYEWESPVKFEIGYGLTVESVVGKKSSETLFRREGLSVDLFRWNRLLVEFWMKYRPSVDLFSEYWLLLRLIFKDGPSVEAV